MSTETKTWRGMTLLPWEDAEKLEAGMATMKTQANVVWADSNSGLRVAEIDGKYHLFVWNGSECRGGNSYAAGLSEDSVKYVSTVYNTLAGAQQAARMRLR